MYTQKSDDVFAIAAFDPSKFSEGFREFAEQGSMKTKEALSKMKEASEDATKTVEATLQSAQAGSVEFGLKAIEMMRTNTENSFSHFEALLGVKSISELVELQTGFFRKQAEIAVEQAKSLQETSRKVAEDVSKPSKDAAEKMMSSMKVA